MTARAWAGFATMSVLWGIPYLFIKVAVDDGLSPAFVAWSRVVLAAAVLLVLAQRAGTLGTVRGKGRWLAAYAFLEITIPFPLIAAGEQHVDSSLAAIIIASVPLLVAVLAQRFDRAERATGRRLVGLLVGFTGVVVLVGIDVAGQSDELLGAAFILIASLGYAAVHSRPSTTMLSSASVDGVSVGSPTSVTGVRNTAAIASETPITARWSCAERWRRSTIGPAA